MIFCHRNGYIEQNQFTGESCNINLIVAASSELTSLMHKSGCQA